MSFHPKMYAKTLGFALVDEVRFLSLDGIVVDYWSVEGTNGARGSYASLHPRLTLLFDQATLSFNSKDWDGGISCSAFFVPAGLHLIGCMENKSRFRHLDIHLHRDLLRKKLGESVDLSEPVFLPDSDDISALGNLLAQECLQRSRSDQHIHTLVDGLFLEVFHTRDKGQQPRSHPSWVERTKSFVLANLGRQITIDTLAKRAGLSRTQFNRQFREATGCSPYQWVKASRIHEAQTMMRAGHSLAHVADAMGFADQSHFNRSFKSVTGKAPSLWMIERETDAVGPNVQDNLA